MIGSARASSPAPADNRPFGQTGVALILSVGIIFSLEVILEALPSNGTAHWQQNSWLRTAPALVPPLLLIVFLARYLETAAAAMKWPILGVLALSNFALQIQGILADPRGLKLISDIILSPNATSYFNDAVGIRDVSGWLSRYQHAVLSLHSTVHPPGPILFSWVFVQVFGVHPGALFTACAIGLIGSAGVVIIHELAGLWTDAPHTRLHAAALYALLPSLIVFFPEFDQAYPTVIMLLILSWSRTLKGRTSQTRLVSAGITGVLLFVAGFFAYQSLVIGAFLLFYALDWLYRERFSSTAVGRFAKSSLVAVAVWFGIYTGLWFITGYNAPAAFIRAMGVNEPPKAYLNFLFFNLWVFSTGLGVMLVPAILLQAWRPSPNVRTGSSSLTRIALATLFVVNFAGLFAGETDRDWLFLMPVLVVPAALEFAHLTPRWRTAVFALQGWIVLCMRVKMSFISP